MMEVVETELCDYLQVRHAKLDSNSPAGSPSKPNPQQEPQSASLPSKFYKHWTPLWVVLNLEISPSYSYIGYCKKESDWLSDSQTIAKCYLDEPFSVERPQPGYSKKYENVLQLIFKGYRLDLGFDSMTKLDQWYKALQVASERHHVDLVRCHEHPHFEGVYVVQVCPSSYVAWNPSSKPPQICWEWHLKHIRRVHWHKNLNKLEVEPGRSSDTGEGHFYFTGQHAYQLFRSMKHMMSTHAQLSPGQSGALRGRGGEREGGSESESDWTGTGDDWTGTSSDSAFINLIRSNHEHLRFTSAGASPSPTPPYRSGSTQSEEIYTRINPQTLNQDNQYCLINQLHPIAVNPPTSPSPRRSPLTTTTISTPKHTVLQLTDSLDDEYCKMVPRASIREGLLVKEGTSPPPIPAQTNHRTV